MTGNQEPGSNEMDSVISDATKKEVGMALTTCIAQAVNANSNNFSPDNYWTFKFESFGGLIDDEGLSPSLMIIMPDEQTASTRNFRTVVKRSGIDEGSARTDDYKVVIQKNTQEVLEVRRATITQDIVEAVTHDSGVDEEEMIVGGIVVALGLGTTEAIEKTAAMGGREIEAQWALSECTEGEAEYFIRLLQSAYPGGSMSDLLL